MRETPERDLAIQDSLNTVPLHHQPLQISISWWAVDVRGRVAQSLIRKIRFAALLSFYRCSTLNKMPLNGAEKLKYDGTQDRRRR